MKDALAVCLPGSSLRRTTAIALAVGRMIAAVNLPFVSSDLGVLTYAGARG